MSLDWVQIMQYSNFILWRLYWLKYKDRGIVLPVAIGLGLIAVLVGTIMLTRSFRDQTEVAARQSATGSESLAELGVTRYLNLVNTNRAIAATPACGGTWNAGGECTNASVLSWFKATGTNPKDGSSFSAFISQLTNPPKSLPETVGSTDVPICDPGRELDSTISNQATQAWKDSTNGTAEGQFRLINYTYNNGNNGAVDDNLKNGVGTLTVEGRIRQAGTGNTATETMGTGLTRLQVTFPVTQRLPGLWIKDKDADAKIPTRDNKDLIVAEVWDSGCYDNTKVAQAATLITSIRDIQSNDYNYINTPDKAFPRYPRAPFAVIPIFEQPPLILSSGTKILKETDGMYRSPYTYLGDRVQGSINLTRDAKLLVDAPGKTVEIALRGSLIVEDNASIEVTKGTTLIIYAGMTSNILIKGEGIKLKNNNDTPDGFQIYAEGITGGATADTWFSLENKARIENLFIFAPDWEFRQCDSTLITGMLWTKKWGRGIPGVCPPGGSPEFRQGKDPVFSKLGLVTRFRAVRPSVEDVSLNTIGEISSWRRCMANINNNDCQVEP